MGFSAMLESPRMYPPETVPAVAGKSLMKGGDKREDQS